MEREEIKAVVKEVIEEALKTPRRAEPHYTPEQEKAATVSCLAGVLERLSGGWVNSDGIKQARAAIGAILKEHL